MHSAILTKHQLVTAIAMVIASTMQTQHHVGTNWQPVYSRYSVTGHVQHVP